MAGKQTFASLPEEILLCIISSLDPRSMVSLQLTSKHLLALCRDNSSWRRLALLPAATTRYRQLYNSAGGGGGGGGTQQPPPPPSPPPLPPPADVHHAINNPSSSSSDQQQYEQQQWYPTLSTRQQARIIANWDTTFPMSREPQRWYDEYIHRHAPVVVNWPQQPTTTTTTTTAAAAGEFAVAAAAGSVPVDVRGLALYRPPAEARAAYAVAPLEDGSVCLWDVKGGSGVSSLSLSSSSKRKGAIVAHSKAGLLWEHVPPHSHPRRSTVTDPGILESVAVDDHRGIAFFAIGNVLVELDLAAMRVVSEKPYDFSINTLSVIQPGVPLTVGTTLGLHLNDHRTPSHSLSPYAALPQPGPISIEHLELPSQPGQISDDLLVAGRFSSILHYDRRQFPRIAGSIYSGAKLCSMASLPYSASFVGNEQRKRLGLTEDEIDTVKSEPGRTLITCGEYKSKGSLEIYGLSASSSADLSPSTAAGQQPQQQPIRNRVTAASAKALYVTNHGSRIVYSDGQGFLKWVERDGFTEVRRHKIGQPGRGSAEGTQSSSSLFRSTLVSSDEIAMKLLSTRTAAPGETDTAQAANADDILFWTGDKLGLATFSSKPAFLPEDFLEDMGEAGPNAQEERLYGERMRLALERQAQDVHFVRELGAGALVGGGF